MFPIWMAAACVMPLQHPAALQSLSRVQFNKKKRWKQQNIWIHAELTDSIRGE